MSTTIGFVCTSDPSVSSVRANKIKQGFGWEKSDCTVVALANVCDIDYATAHQYMKAHGRKDREGAYFHIIMTQKQATNTPVFGYKVSRTRYAWWDEERQPVYEMGYSEYWGCPTRKVKSFGIKRMTVKKFIEDNPIGRFVLEVPAHVLTVIDGVIYDYKNSQYREVMVSTKFEKI